MWRVLVPLIEITAILCGFACDTRQRHPPATPASDARQRRTPATPVSDARQQRPPATPASDARQRRSPATPAPALWPDSKAMGVARGGSFRPCEQPQHASSGDGRSARQARVDVASRFCATLNLPCGFDPHSLLVFDRPWLSVVACPLLDLVPGAEYEFAVWRTLADVANCDVYLPIISALSRVASHCQRGTPISLVDVADGAMRA